MMVFYSDGDESNVGNYPDVGFLNDMYKLDEAWDYKFDKHLVF